MIKKVIIVLFILISHPVHPLQNDNPIFLSPEQLQEDAVYFFEIIGHMHPNMYHFCGMEAFENKKHILFSQLGDSLTVDNFFNIISSINSCLDPHSGFKWMDHYLPSFKKMENKLNAYFPEILYENEKIFTLINNKYTEIIYINDVAAQDIMVALHQRLQQYPPETYKLFFENLFSLFLSGFFISMRLF